LLVRECAGLFGQTEHLNVEEGAAPLAFRLDDVVELYCLVFNGISGIRPLWTFDRARLLLRERVRQTGLVSVLVVDSDRVAGAFIAVLAPKSDGIGITEVDLLVHPDYRGCGLGRELYYTGCESAARTGVLEFGEWPSTIEFSTYQHPDFPKNWWMRLGYRPFRLFSAGAEIDVGKGISQEISMRDVGLGEVDGLAAFMAGGDVQNLNGDIWTESRSAAFLKFMIENRGSVVQVAEGGDGILALIAGGLVMRRSGPVLRDITYLDQNSDAVTEKMLAGLVARADLHSLQTFGLPLQGLELGELEAMRLRAVLPGMGMEDDFIGMSMAFDGMLDGREYQKKPARVPEPLLVELG
jgi:GNAT superfamily N-acetyltransferase